jgi:hypothetical protein
LLLPLLFFNQGSDKSVTSLSLILEIVKGYPFVQTILYLSITSLLLLLPLLFFNQSSDKSVTTLSLISGIVKGCPFVQSFVHSIIQKDLQMRKMERISLHVAPRHSVEGQSAERHSPLN